MGTFATVPECGLQKGSIVRFISLYTGTAATVIGLGLRYQEVTAPISLHTLTDVNHIKHSALGGFRIYCTKLTKNYNRQQYML